MSRWTLEFLPDAEKDLAKIDRADRRRVIAKLEWLLNNFDKIFPSVLSGEFKEFYKLRAGDWRIFYKINWRNRLVIICLIDRRDKIYKKK